MTIGLGTYAFFWQWHETAETPLSLTDMVDRTADLGVGLFQICDYPLIESYDSNDLDQLRVSAANGECAGAWHSRSAAGAPSALSRDGPPPRRHAGPQHDQHRGPSPESR